MSEERSPDGLLLRRYREGDEAAFAELRRRHGRLVLATCRRETGDPALAEDAAQGVFLLLTRKRFDERASLAGWLHEAARLVSRNVVRGEARRRRCERRAFEEFHEPTAGWDAAAPHVDDALSSLSAKDREAVLLRFAGEMSLAEVGRALGMEENAARMRVARALERMRTHLRRAGVGVSVLLLATLLSTRLADAEGAFPIGDPSTRAKRAARRALPGSFAWKPIGLGIATVVVGSIALRPLFSGTPRLSAAEAARLFHAAEGGWRGMLAFADDATGARTTTPTMVRVDRATGGIRLVARYSAFRASDTMTIVPQADGRFEVVNAGTHRLDGVYDLVRLRDGSPAFVGFSPAVRGEVRLRLRATEGVFTLREEVRRGGAYRFRNQFDLRR